MKKIYFLLPILLFTLLFTSCKSDDNETEPTETLTEKNLRLINGDWKITNYTINSIVQDLGDCLINNETNFNITTMKFKDKTFIFNGNCEFSIYENDFEINDNTLIKYDGNVGISNNILLLNETTLKYNVQNQELTYTKL